MASDRSESNRWWPRMRVAVVALALGFVAVSCSRVAAPLLVVQQGYFNFILHLATDSTVEGTADFDNATVEGVPVFQISFISSNPEFTMTIQQEGVRPIAGEYPVYNEPVALSFNGTFLLGDELEGVTYELASGVLRLTKSTQEEIAGSIDIDAIATNGPNPGRRITIDGLFRAPCFNNCPPPTGGGPS